jgi:hypothetical protein
MLFIVYLPVGCKLMPRLVFPPPSYPGQAPYVGVVTAQETYSTMPLRLTCSIERFNFEKRLVDHHNMLPENLHYRYLDLYFTTATIKRWKHLLKQDKYKQIVVDSLEYLAREKTVKVYAFVIMPNHFHLIWQMTGEQSLSMVQLRLLKFVAQQIKFDLD